MLYTAGSGSEASGRLLATIQLHVPQLASKIANIQAYYAARNLAFSIQSKILAALFKQTKGV